MSDPGWLFVAALCRDLSTLIAIAISWFLAMLWLGAFEDVADRGG